MTADATALTAPVNGHLDYLSQLAQQLGVRDPVESYLVPVLGKWSDLHDEAGRWRSAAQVASSVTARLTAPLAGLDAAWQGADADSFLEYMQNVGLAGHDLADALGAMADALDRTAQGIQQIASELVDVLVETAEQSSDAMTVPVAGATRAQQHLDEVTEPASQMYNAVRDVLDGFVKLCNGVHGGQLFGQITMAHQMPAQNWSPPAVATPPAFTPQPASTPPTGASTAAPAPAAATPASASPASATPASATPASATPAAQPAAASVPAAHAGGGMPAHAAAGGGGGGMPAGGGLPTSGNVAAQQTGPPAVSSAVATPSGSTPPTVPGSTPVTAGSAADPTAAGGSGGGGMPMGMGGMGGMRGGGGDSEHKSKIGVSGDPREIFGKPERTAPPVIGEE